MFQLVFNTSQGPACFSLLTTTHIGRGSECEVRLADPSVSRLHCRIQCDKNSARLIDAQSRWGTRVNGILVHETLLKHGDLIEVGDTVLRIESIAESPHTTVSLSPVGSCPASDSLDQEVESDDSADASSPYVIAQDWEAQRLHRFRIGGLIARARTGLVFHATDSAGGQRYAIKLFHPVNFQKPEAWKRFLRAVRLSPSFRCEQIVPVIAAGRQGGVCFTVSRFVEGGSVAEWIRRTGIAGMIDWPTALSLAKDVSQALIALESAEVVHRNITPQNILIQQAGTNAYLNDVILSRAWDTVSNDRVTTDGELVGDLAYCAPETLGSGFPVDSRADQYSLGATLYAMLAGRPPFQAPSLAAMIPLVLHQSPASPREFNLAIPAPVEAVILRLLSKRPDQRYQSSVELAEDLRKVSRSNIRPD